MNIPRSFKSLTAQWTRRAAKLGDAGVGRAGEDHVQQAERIEGWLDDLLPDRFYHHVLDFGCGWGRFTKFLESRGSHIWAVDVVPAWVNRAQQSSNTLTAIQLSDPALPLDTQSMDLIVDVMTLQSITDTQLAVQLMAELRRVAAPNGNIISVHKADNLRLGSVATALGFDKNWTAVASTEVDVAGDMYCFLLGRRIP